MAAIVDGDYYILSANTDNKSQLSDFTVYCVIRSDGQDYIMTTDYAEYWTLVWRGGWRDHGTFNLHANDQTNAVYRVYLPNVNRHYFTTDRNVYNQLISGGGRSESNGGIAFFGNANTGKNIGVYCLTKPSPNGAGPNLQIFTSERDIISDLTTNQGWTNSGVMIYADGTMALDNDGCKDTDFNNIQVYPVNNTDAQIWHISTREDGSRQIENRYNGKVLDVEGGTWSNGSHDGSYWEGQNVILYHDDDLSNQRWEIVPNQNGSSVLYRGKSYPTYKIKLWKDPNNKPTYLNITGATENTPLAPGINVGISFVNKAYVGDWAFVPVPPLRPNQGCYSIRPEYDTSLKLHAAADSDGANVFIARDYPGAMRYWTIIRTATTDKYVIANYASGGRVLDVIGKEQDIQEDQNVDLWSYDAYTEDWTIQEYGTMKVDGQECLIVSLEVQEANSKFRLDAELGKLDNGTNVRIHDVNESMAERWVLVPEDPFDGTMPVPSEVVLCSDYPYFAPGDRAYEDRLVPAWKGPTAWNTNSLSSLFYQFRWRKRLFNGVQRRWEGWSSFTPWEDAVVKLDDDKNNYLAKGIDTSYNTDLYSNMDVCMQVRCAGRSKVLSTYDEFHSKFVGLAASKVTVGPIRTDTHRNTFVPTITFTKAVMSFDGLHLSFKSDYKTGTINMFVMNVQVQQGQKPWASALALTKDADILAGCTKTNCYSADDVINIPIKYLTRVILPGDSVRVIYQIGNDQQFRWTWRVWEGTVAASESGGNTNIFGGVRKAGHHTAIVSIANFDKHGMWLYQNGNVFALPRLDTVSNGYVSYVVPYTWGPEPGKIVASAYQLKSNKWGVHQFDASECGLDMTPVHVWLLNDCTEICLDCRKDKPLSSNESISAAYTSYELASREHELVTFGSLKKNEFSVNGTILHPDKDEYDGEHTHSTVSDFKFLVGKHALYRNPYGTLMNVAVTKVSIESYHSYTDIEVTMIQETK